MTHSSIVQYTHLVWSTEGRLTWLTDQVLNEVIYVVGREANKRGCTVIAAGGYLDHLHILLHEHSGITLKWLVRALKSRSSRILNARNKTQYYWQRGYSACSVSVQDVDIIKNYILRQKQLHQQRTILIQYEPSG